MGDDNQVFIFRSIALRIIKGALNGANYGAKVRFAHALVMALLFSKAPLPERLNRIVTATAKHASTLAKFVFVYKSMLVVLQAARHGYITSRTGSAATAKKYETFMAGCVSGYFVFGKDFTPITEQIILYLVSRTLTGGARYFTAGTELSTPYAKDRAWELTSALAWGCVMYLFNTDSSVLQSSLAKSMRFMYLESDIVENMKFSDLFRIF